MTRLLRTCRLTSPVLALVLGILMTAPAAVAKQRVVTWNLTSKYITKADALAGLSGTEARAAGPTGLRSWVILPPDYTTKRCWPVIYILHAAGSADEWLGDKNLYASMSGIVVIPGGGDGQYTNWWNGGARSPQWESWFLNELLRKVSKTFSVCPQRSAHAIAGSSMGGFGAMYLAAQRPDYFGTAASFSGIIDIEDSVIQFGFNDYAEVWGPPGGFYAAGHDPAYLLPALKSTRLFVYVGNGTPLAPAPPSKVVGGQVVESVMRQQAAGFLAAARRDHVHVNFVEHGGFHTQDNWNLSLEDLMAANPFGPVTENPASWRYTTTDQSGQAWGYRYSFVRPPANLESFQYANGVLRGDGSGEVALVSPTGQRFRAKMPFAIKDGVVQTGHSGIPVYKPSSLPIELTVSTYKILRRAAIRVNFKPRSLPAGSSYEVTVFQGTKACTVRQVTRLRMRKPGTSVVLVLRPGVSEGHPRRRWCGGGGTVNLTVVPNDNSSALIGRLVGSAPFLAY